MIVQQDIYLRTNKFSVVLRMKIKYDHVPIFNLHRAIISVH
jgi:hypothetical protein